MNLKSKQKVHLKPTKKYVFKLTFWFKKLKKFICNKLENEDQPMF